MLDSLRALSNEAEAVDANSDAAAALGPLLQDGESVRYVLSSSKGVEQTAEGRSTTVQPDGSHDAYAIVTDHRALFLVGSAGDDPSADVDFDLSSVTMCKARSSLLSTSLVVVSEGTSTVKFTPSGGPDLEEVVDYIDRVGSAWVDLERALAATEESIDAYADALEAGEDAHEYLTQARQRLSNAHHHATRNDDGPVEQMLALVEPVEADLNQIQVRVRLDRVEELLDAARDEDTFEEAVRSVVEADRHLGEARDALDADAANVDSASAAIDDSEAAVDAVAASLLADAEDACHEAAAAGDPADAAAAWEQALDRYRAALVADWDGLGGVDEDALRFQTAWVVGNRVDALLDLAATLEARGDDRGDDEATECFERAKASAESARDLAADHPYVDAGPLADRVDELEEKIEVSEWQWGDA